MKKTLLLVMLSLVLFTGLVSAANTVTLITPAASESISGTSYFLNATLDSNSLTLNNATFYYRLSGGSWVEISSIVNETAISFNITFDTTALIDAINVSFNVTVRNATAFVTQDTSISVAIDNGNPTATLSSGSLADNSDLIKGITTFTMGLDADSTIGINNCTISFGGNLVQIAAVGNQCNATMLTNANFSVTDLTFYTVFVTARDANGDETNSVSRTFKLTDPGGTGGGSSGGSSSTTTTQDDTKEDISTGASSVSGADSTSKDNIFSRFFSWLKNIFSRN